MADGEMDSLVERLAMDSVVWRRLKKRVEARREELFPPAPPAPPYHGMRGHGGDCMCAECFGAEAIAPGHRLRDEEGRM